MTAAAFLPMTICIAGCASVSDGLHTELPAAPAALMAPVPVPVAVPNVTDARVARAELDDALKLCNGRLGKSYNWYQGVRKTFAGGR